MDDRRTIALVDGDFRRRAAICHALADGGIHVEPFESPAELTERWPTSSLILSEDDGHNITDLIDHMSEVDVWLPVIAFAEQPETQRVVQAIRAGAVEYLEWPFTAERLQQVLDSAETTATLIGSLRQREAMARQRLRRLTRREREVLAGIAGGLSNRMIGEKLAISPRTVEIHRANMLMKIGASRTSEAIRIAIEASLVR